MGTKSEKYLLQYLANMKLSGKLILRTVLLFAVGVFFALLLDTFQSHRYCSFKYKAEPRFLYTPWWIQALSGTASAIVGLLYPHLGFKIGEHQIDSEEWPKVIRCVAVFVGINQAATKIHFSSNFQLTMALAILSIGLWWVFDGTCRGFQIGVTSAIAATFITHIIVCHQLCKFTEHEFLYIQSWLPCIVFSGGITIGNIGRQLALIEGSDTTTKIHQE